MISSINNYLIQPFKDGIEYVTTQPVLYEQSIAQITMKIGCVVGGAILARGAIKKSTSNVLVGSITTLVSIIGAIAAWQIHERYNKLEESRALANAGHELQLGADRIGAETDRLETVVDDAEQENHSFREAVEEVSVHADTMVDAAETMQEAAAGAVNAGQDVQHAVRRAIDTQARAQELQRENLAALESLRVLFREPVKPAEHAGASLSSSSNQAESIPRDMLGPERSNDRSQSFIRAEGPYVNPRQSHRFGQLSNHRQRCLEVEALGSVEERDEIALDLHADQDAIASYETVEVLEVPIFNRKLSQAEELRDAVPDSGLLSAGLTADESTSVHSLDYSAMSIAELRTEEIKLKQQSDALNAQEDADMSDDEWESYTEQQEWVTKQLAQISQHISNKLQA